jgi:CheY-like chemotaxis protein
MNMFADSLPRRQRSQIALWPWELLQSLGFACAEASDGRVAVHWCLGNGPDADLMDLQMPVLNGIEAAREMRHLQQCQAIPVVGAVPDI